MERAVPPHDPPDAKPIVGFDRDVEGLFHAVGMCGQGLMLGPPGWQK